MRVCVCMCVWHVWLVLCMQVAGKGVPAWPDIPKQQGNQLGNLTPADRHGSVQVSHMWTPHIILSEESGRLQTSIWIVTPCYPVVDMKISEECVAFISESQEAVGCIGWVHWRSDELLLKPLKTVNVTIHWFAVGSVSCLHFTDLINYLSLQLAYITLLMSEMRMEAACASRVSVFCEAKSHIPENHNLKKCHCEELNPFKITVLCVVKHIMKQLIGVEQHMPCVVVPLHQMQEIRNWEKP